MSAGKQSKILLASFDMDGTLLEEDSSWAALHRHFGTSELGRASLKLYTEGKIDYIEFMRRDISAWPKDLNRAEVTSVLSKYKLRKESAEVVDGLKERGIDVSLVTSGIDILAEQVCLDLGIRHWVANGLGFDRHGLLTGHGVGRVDPTRKDVAYLELLGRLGIDSKQTIAVGDTIYDLRFLKTAAIGFMLAHTTRVDDPNIVHIDKLTDIFDHLGRTF